MSTQEIGALIESVNDLTQTVAGKMGEIDQKVDQATASVPNTIRLMSSVNYHVSNDGSDEVGDGTSGKPFKTILHAIKQAIPGSLVTIALKDNQEYICESNQHHNSSNGKDILITSYGSTGIKPTLRFRMTKDSNGGFGESYICNYFEGSSFSISFHKVNLIHEPIADGGTPYTSDSFGGVITRGTSGGGGMDISVRFSDSPVTTGDHPFITGQMGYVNLHMNYSPITKGGEVERFMPGSGLPLARMIGLKNTAISGFSSNLPKDLFGYDETRVSEVVGQGI